MDVKMVMDYMMSRMYEASSWAGFAAMCGMGDFSTLHGMAVNFLGGMAVMVKERK